jgi:predicted transposase/invertase (TIGR01784 family)
MLITEWDWDKYVEVQRREAVEEGIIVGREEGLMKGREKRSEEIARSALAEGASVEFVRKITGLDSDTIQRLANQ